MPLSPINSLREETKVMAALLDVLRQEQQCLIAADIDTLATLTAGKSALVGQMSQLSQLRHQALEQAGHFNQDAGMDAWIAASGETEALPMWQSLLEQTRAAKELNRVNGMLINKQMSYTQGALDALRPRGSSAAVYGPSGLTSSAPRSRGFLAG
ncbi:flagella synthesis protein FlgN [Oxalobacteraceae bacterium A2-2]